MTEKEAESKLVVAISSRALFNLDNSHEIFQEQGIDAYCEYQIAHEDDILNPGVAFPLVQKLLGLNEKLPETASVEIILLSRNSADTGLRIFNSIQHHKLNIIRAAFTGGSSTYRYAKAMGAHLFLSANPNDVHRALESGLAAATILPSPLGASHSSSDQLRCFPTKLNGYIKQRDWMPFLPVSKRLRINR